MLSRALTLMTLLSIAILPATLPATEISITGRILGPDDTPVARAEIRLEKIPSTHERALLRLADQTGPDPVARSRSTSEGTFELKAPSLGISLRS